MNIKSIEEQKLPPHLRDVHRLLENMKPIAEPQIGEPVDLNDMAALIDNSLDENERAVVIQRLLQSPDDMEVLAQSLQDICELAEETETSVPLAEDTTRIVPFQESMTKKPPKPKPQTGVNWYVVAGLAAAIVLAIGLKLISPSEPLNKDVYGSFAMTDSVQEFLTEIDGTWDSEQQVADWVNHLRAMGFDIAVGAISKIRLTSEYQTSKDIFGPEEIVKIEQKGDVIYVTIELEDSENPQGP